MLSGPVTTVTMTCCSLSGPVVMVMDLVDEFISRSCPFVAAGVVIGSVYWTAVTFGAVTVMQVRVRAKP